MSATLSGPFTANGTAIITVAHTNHGATEGDFVTYSGASTLNGADFNAEYEITSIVDANSYTITHTGNVSSGTGGGTVTANISIKCRFSYK